MVYALTYRRPPQSQKSDSQDSLSDDEKQKALDESVPFSGSPPCHGVPDALSFESIISGGTCPPCTTRDFMNYLKYIEHNAENLQFYLWYRNYLERWNQLPADQKALAVEWDQIRAEAEANMPVPRRKIMKPEIATLLQATDFAEKPVKVDRIDPFNSPLKQSLDDNRPLSDRLSDMSGGPAVSAHIRETMVEQAFEDADLKWQPFSAQPYRDEVRRVISVYIAEGASRELNISARERQAVLHALQNTTHPSAFKVIVSSVEWSLRKQSHPNFIRWTICNGNKPRVLFARGLGITGIVLGFVADLIITLSSASRAYRIIPFLGWFLGFATLIAAWKGMCVVLHGLHHRHLRPWELFADEPEEANEKTRSDSDSHEVPSLMGGANSYEDEPWLAKYDRRNIVRKIFDREVWVRDPTLRQIQDTIFLQSVLAGFILSCIAVGIFCAVPNGNFF